MKKISLIMLVSLLLVPFQNCSVQFRHGSKDSQSKSSAPTENNGTGYGGKVYAAGEGINRCPDGTAYEAFSTLSASAALTIRENCADINPPKALDLTQPSITPMYSALPQAPFDLYIHKGLVFEAPLPATPVRPMRVMFACRGSANGQPLNVVIKEDGSQPLLYFAGTVLYNGAQQRHMPDMQLSLTPNKYFQGNDSGATYTLDILDPTANPQPWASTFTYTSAGLNFNATLNCYSSHY